MLELHRACHTSSGSTSFMYGVKSSTEAISTRSAFIRKVSSQQQKWSLQFYLYKYVLPCPSVRLASITLPSDTLHLLERIWIPPLSSPTTHQPTLPPLAVAMNPQTTPPPQGRLVKAYQQVQTAPVGWVMLLLLHTLPLPQQDEEGHLPTGRGCSYYTVSYDIYLQLCIVHSIGSTVQYIVEHSTL